MAFLEGPGAVTISTYLGTTTSDHEDTSSPLLVGRDWLFIPASGTVPLEIHVLVILAFCEVPKALVTRRLFGHLCPHKDPKGIAKEDIFLSLSAVLSYHKWLCQVLSCRQGPECPTQTKMKVKFGNPLLHFL